MSWPSNLAVPSSTIQRLSRLALLGIFKNIATIPQTGGEGEKGGGGEQGEGGGQASRRKLWQLKVGQVPHICLEPDGVPGNIQSCPGVKYYFFINLGSISRFLSSWKMVILQIFAWGSLGMVLVSTFTFILGTLPGAVDCFISFFIYITTNLTNQHVFLRIPKGVWDWNTFTIPRGPSCNWNSW